MGGGGGLKTIIFRPQGLELAGEEDGAAASSSAVSGNVHGLVNGAGGADASHQPHCDPG